MEEILRVSRQMAEIIGDNTESRVLTESVSDRKYDLHILSPGVYR